MKEQPQTKRMNWHYLIWWSVKEDHREYWKELMKIQPPYDLNEWDGLGALSFYNNLKPPTLSTWSDTNPHKKEALREVKIRHKELMDQLEFNKKSYPYLDPITGKEASREDEAIYWNWRRWFYDEVFRGDGSRLYPDLDTHWMMPPDGDTIRTYIGKLKDGWIPKKPWTYIPHEHNTYIYKDGITDEGQQFLFPYTKDGSRLKRTPTIRERQELARIEIKKEIEEEKRKLGPELYKKYFPHKDQPFNVDEMRKIQEDMPKTRESRKFYKKMKKLFHKEVPTTTGGQNNER